MGKEYDFSSARPSPWAGRVKQPVTIRIDRATIAYFKKLAVETKLPYQSLINLYLLDCAANGRKPNILWERPKRSKSKGKGKREKGASRR